MCGEINVAVAATSGGNSLQSRTTLKNDWNLFSTLLCLLEMLKILNEQLDMHKKNA